MNSIQFHSHRLKLAILFCLLTSGCGTSETPPAPVAPTVPTPTTIAPTPTPDISPKGDPAMSFQLVSTAFEAGTTIPKKYTGDGEDVSPALSWSNVPKGTKQLALICDDPDAPTPEPWVHWVLYPLSPSLTELPEGLATLPNLETPIVAKQGKNSWKDGNTIGYRGPAPPPGHGVHRYFFKLYALDVELDLEPGLTKTDLLKAMEGHILGQAELLGTYERK